MSVELFMLLYYLSLTALVVVLTSYQTTKQKDTKEKPKTLYKTGILQYEDPDEAIRYVFKRTAHLNDLWFKRVRGKKNEGNS